MLNEGDAIQRADRLIRDTANSRSFFDAQWALAMAYATGVQWARIGQVQGRGRKIHRLPPLINPNRTDVRVTVDMIGQMVDRFVACTKPARIDPVVVPTTHTAEGLVSKGVYEAILRKRLVDMNGLKVWRSLHLPRTVLGTSCVRRQMTSVGRSKKLKQMSQRRPGQHLQLRQIDVGWARVAPFEIIRDPAADSTDPNENETIFGHEKPRSTEWIAKNFGVQIKTETNFGHLLDYQNQIRSATGWMNARHVTDSKTPAVMVYEFFFQDGDAGIDWPHHLLAYLDPNEEADGEHRLRPLHFGPNPFFGLPFHFLFYKTDVVGPWGRGLPLTLKDVQDVSNMAWTAMTRVMIDHYPKWRIQEDTVDNPDEIANRTDVPIIFRKRAQHDHTPDRVGAPGANPIATDMAAQLKDVGRGMANMSAIQFGESVKRGQSGEAYKTVQDSADSVVNDIQTDDRIVLEELLYGTLLDTGRQLSMRRDVARKMLGDRFTEHHVSIAFSKPTRQLIEAVKILPSSMRNRTPNQVRDEFVEASKAGVIEPLAARREMLEQGNVITDTVMDRAKRKQELEIEMLRRGEQVMPTIGEDHATSIWVLEKTMSSEEWMNFTPEQQEAVTEHWNLHKQAQMQLQLEEQQVTQGPAGGQPGAQGTPPANASPVLAQAETVGSL